MKASRGSRLLKTNASGSGIRDVRVWASFSYRAGVCFVLVAGGCASLPAPPVYPVGSAYTARDGLSDDRPPRAVLRAGDELVVAVSSGGQSHERAVQVDARGELHVAAGRDVPVAGLPLEQAQGRVADAVHMTEKHAEVDLHVSERPSQRISVLGALRRPGYLALRPGMRVIDLIADAGGVLTVTSQTGALPLPVADLDTAVLTRDGKALPISLREALRGTTGHNVYVYPGDQLYVPLATDRSVSVFGQVGTPGAFIHRRGLRLTEALATAGGITSGGDKSDVRLIRGPVDKPKVYRASLSAIADGKAHDVRLRPGDVVFVQDSPMEDAGEVVRLLAPFASLGIFVLAIVLITSP